MTMQLGIQKRQWLLLLLGLCLPLLVNAAGIWLEIGTSGTLQLLQGTYQPSNPNLPLASRSAILSGLFPIVALLGILFWLVMFISNRAFFQRQWPPVKWIETLLVVILLVKAFEIATIFLMPFAWLPEFHDYLLGLPVSDFMLHGGRWLTLPATTIIFLVAISLSGNGYPKTGKQVTPSGPDDHERG